MFNVLNKKLQMGKIRSQKKLMIYNKIRTNNYVKILY